MIARILSALHPRKGSTDRAASRAVGETARVERTAPRASYSQVDA